MNDERPTVYYPLSVLDSMMLEQHQCEDDVVALAVARAVAEERAAVVAWLRERGEHDHERNHHRAEALWDAAAVIECGEHHREDER